MKKYGNKFTVKFTISSQNALHGCELIVNQNGSNAQADSNMGVPLRNKQGDGGIFVNRRMKELKK